MIARLLTMVLLHHLLPVMVRMKAGVAAGRSGWDMAIVVTAAT
jgi:hypothetical protein